MSPTSGTSSLFGLSDLASLLLVYSIVGNLASFLTIISLLIHYTFEILNIDSTIQKRITAHAKAQAELARQKRSNEIKVISNITERVARHALALKTEEAAKQKLEHQKREQELKAELEDQKETIAELEAELAGHLEEASRQQKEAEQEEAEQEEAEQEAAAKQEAFRRRLAELIPAEFSHLPGSSCIGTTRRGDRCGQCMISKSSLADANARLRVLLSDEPGDSFEFEVLEKLADCMLCPRWHRYKIPQGNQIARRWYRELAPAREALAERYESDSETEGDSEAATSTPATPVRSPSLSIDAGRSGSPDSGYSGSPPMEVFSSSSKGFAATGKVPEARNLTREFEGAATVAATS